MTKKPPERKEGSDAATFVSRFWEFDVLRGIAIVLMVVYHCVFLVWMLAPTLATEVINPLSTGWLVVGRTASTLFLLLVGISLVASFQKASGGGGHNATGRSNLLWRQRIIQRSVQLFFWGVVLSVITTMFIPGYGIYFGILHLIAVGCIVALPMVSRPLVALVATLFFVGGALWHPSWVVYLAERIPSFGIVVGVPPTGFQSVDYWPVFPWLALVTFGVALGTLLFRGMQRNYSWPAAQPFFCRPLSWLGERSLLVYLIHMPVISVVLLVLYKLTL